MRSRILTGFCGRVAGPLLARRAHDGLPPDVGGRLAAGRLLGADEARREVGHAVDVGVVEDVVRRIARVPEDDVVLGRPARARTGAVVVGPDDLIDERPAAEQPVEQHLAVVRLARVDVEEEGPVGREHAPRRLEPRREEPQVVVEDVVPGRTAQHLGAVPLAGEPVAVAVRVAHRAQARALLHLARVERRVEVDEPGDALRPCSAGRPDSRRGRCASQRVLVDALVLDGPAADGLRRTRAGRRGRGWRGSRAARGRAPATSPRPRRAARPPGRRRDAAPRPRGRRPRRRGLTRRRAARARR